MEDLLNNEMLKDRFRAERFTTKEDLLAWISDAKKRIRKKSETDNHHSAAFFHAYENLLIKFEERILKTVLFTYLEDCWCYGLCICNSGAELTLHHAARGQIGKDGQIVVTEDQEFTLLTVNTKLLTVEAYANTYGVNAGTVRQWIRRGKIRTAVKLGNEWRIPELTDKPTRGYRSALYTWSEYLRDLPKEYEYLRSLSAVLFNQDPSDKNNFLVTFAGYDSVEVVYNTKEREKLELFLISHPQIEYVGTPEDGLNVSITRKNFTGELF